MKYAWKRMKGDEMYPACVQGTEVDKKDRSEAMMK